MLKHVLQVIHCGMERLMQEYESSCQPGAHAELATYMAEVVCS